MRPNRVEAQEWTAQNPRDVLGRSRHADTIRKLPLFEGCTRGEAASIARIGHEQSFPAGRELTREGVVGDDFYVLLDGEVEVLRDGAPVARMAAGEFFGEIALLGHSTRTATVRTTGPVRAFVIPGRGFRALLGRQPDVQLKVLDALADRL
jgi:CRP-like cAMP-binding protein